jgi:hypothetical protein
MAVPSINNLKMWVGTLFTKDDWDFNFSQIVDWLSGGNSDLVVNSIKATNGIDLDGSQLSNLAPATTGSQAITLDQAQTLLNRTSYFYPFSVASGKVDNSGNAAYLQKDNDTQVTVLAGNVNPDLVVIQSDATIESLTANTVLTIPTADGTYHIIKEKGESIGITTGTANKITIDKAFPSSQNIGDYFLDNSTVPFKGYKYTTTGWVETPFCYLGYVTVSSGVATVTGFSYNFNNFDANSSKDSINFFGGLLAPDYSRGVSVTLPYTASANGYISASLLSNGSTVTVKVNNVVVGIAQNTAGDTRYTDQSANTFPIAKGQTVTATNSGSGCHYWFIPMKGVN